MKSLITKTLVQIALEEDIGSGDITTKALVDPDLCGKATIIAKQELVIAGLEMVNSVYQALSPNNQFIPNCQDGDTITTGQMVCEIKGSLCSLLEGERTALNFLQRMSGIATQTRRYVNLLNRKKPLLVDTRKTLPGWRRLEKIAVRIGGAMNHRMGLYDGVLIKDNHIMVSGGIGPAIACIRQKVSHLTKIEIEVENFDQLEQALAAKVDVIMLDNMTINDIHLAVQKINGQALVEVSGGITLEHIQKIADTGVDIISIGALTHSAQAVDLSMQIEQDS
ncbi:MAG: carboxylating nicotinate-nucleotide diphosphorylase [Candidatus Magnetomorum sp.]|nr:carboxylating nicotinate-nucleotide diphosphorylase [Candidatus Magnetomorum sp.]